MFCWNLLFHVKGKYYNWWRNKSIVTIFSVLGSVSLETLQIFKENWKFFHFPKILRKSFRVWTRKLLGNRIKRSFSHSICFNFVHGNLWKIFPPETFSIKSIFLNFKIVLGSKNVFGGYKKREKIDFPPFLPFSMGTTTNHNFYLSQMCHKLPLTIFFFVPFFMNGKVISKLYNFHLFV